MRKIKLYIAASLNGKIARSDGSVDWLETIPNPEDTDHGYKEFYSSIDTTLQGFNTYKQIIDWDIPFPYANKKNYVITKKTDRKNTKHVEFISENHIEFIKSLKEKKGKDIWLIGGAQVNTMLLNADLIDEIQVFVMPIIIPDGIDIFEHLPKEQNLKLIESRNFLTGAVELRYKL